MQKNKDIYNLINQIICVVSIQGEKIFNDVVYQIRMYFKYKNLKINLFILVSIVFTFNLRKEKIIFSNLQFDSRIVIPSKTQSNLFFTAKTPQQAQDWIRAIQQSINTSYGKLYKLEKILYQPEFQKFDHIIEQQFKRQCNSGDIILFQDSHTFAKVQRAVTFSEYDHVGIILKNRRDEVVILQSSSNNGVAFTFWRQLIRYKWYDSIPRITWRKLNIQRNNKDINIMEEFIINNLNKQYGLNFEKLLKFKSKINKTAEEQKNRTYFCSQLVAALYKKLGLIQQQQSTTQFWPVHFSDSKKLKLLRGNLQHQRIIVFQNSLLSKQNKKK